jgi:hypothetical protein
LGGLGAPAYFGTGSFPLAVDLGDLDGDGDLDMISSNYSGDDFTLYENDGTGNFINPITYQNSQNQAGSCALFHDRNNDGIMDMTAVDEIADIVVLYENSPLTRIDVIENREISVYPNPTSNWLAFSGLKSLEIVSLHDSSGKQILEIQGNSTVDVSEFASGFYTLKSNLGWTEKVIIR